LYAGMSILILAMLWIQSIENFYRIIKKYIFHYFLAIILNFEID
jgi:hypothetical protein